MYYVIIGLQLLGIIHAIKNGKTSPWLYIIMFLPGVGVLAYLFVEVLPEFGIGRKIAGARFSLKSLIHPNWKIKRLEEELQYKDTVDLKLALAEAYEEAEMYDKAIDMYKQSVTGLYAGDADNWKRLGLVQYKAEKYEDAKSTFEHLKTLRKTLKPDELLYYALSLEKTGTLKNGLKLFSEVADTSPGMEGNYHYLRLLKKEGKEDEVAKNFPLAQRKFAAMYPNIKRLERPWMNKIEKDFT